jgi:hypothetical protein
MLLDLGHANDSLNMTPKAKATKVKINKWDYIKRKTWHSKEHNPQDENETYVSRENKYKPNI